MGLVNLRNAKLLVLSVTQSRLSELKSVSAKAGFKAVQFADSIPSAIAALKGGKTDVLVVDSDLGGTAIADFLKAIQSAFPKVKILSILPPIPEGQTPKGGNLHFPLEDKSFGKAVDHLVMAKMGISSSAVAMSEDY